MQATDRVGDSQIYLFFYYTMEKLLQLLNEYSPLKYPSDEYCIEYGNLWIKTRIYAEPDVYTNYTLMVISKKFWFIEWLVDNDKIDYYKVGEIVDTYKWSLREKAYVVSDCVVESMLMILAIQDDPISFLISVLK